MVRVKSWWGPIKWYMKLCGFSGWTSFWNTIYINPDYIFRQRLIRHEMAHIDQIQRDGRIVFTLKYLFWTVKYGYWNNPYEIEARQKETGDD